MKYPAIQNFISGKFVSAATTRKLSAISPIDGALLSEIPMSSNANLDNAFQSAKTAFPGWSKTPVKDTIQVFFKYKTLLEKNLQELAELCSEENGKTIGESIAEIEKCVELTQGRLAFLFQKSFFHLATGCKWIWMANDAIAKWDRIDASYWCGRY